MDIQLRDALRNFRSNPGDNVSYLPLIVALDRAGLLPDQTPEWRSLPPLLVSAPHPNQQVIHMHDGDMLISYSTPVMFRPSDRSLPLLRLHPSPSRTTSKHMTQFSMGRLPSVAVSEETLTDMLRVTVQRPAVSSIL